MSPRSDELLASLQGTANFTRTFFVQLLDSIDSSQHYIENLSKWALQYPKYGRVITEIWLSHFLKATPKQHLPLFYLANDIIQNSYRKGFEFSEQFTDVLPKALNHLVRQGDDEILQKVERTLQIWADRNIYEDEFLNCLWAEILDRETRVDGDELSAKQLKKLKLEVLDDRKKGRISSAEEIVRIINDLDAIPKNDELLEQTLKSIDPSTLEKEIERMMKESANFEQMMSSVNRADAICTGNIEGLHANIDKLKSGIRKMDTFIIDEQRKLNEDYLKIEDMEKQMGIKRRSTRNEGEVSKEDRYQLSDGFRADPMQGHKRHKKEEDTRVDRSSPKSTKTSRFDPMNYYLERSKRK